MLLVMLPCSAMGPVVVPEVHPYTSSCWRDGSLGTLCQLSSPGGLPRSIPRCSTKHLWA